MSQETEMLLERLKAQAAAKTPEERKKSAARLKKAIDRCTQKLEELRDKAGVKNADL